MMEGSGSVPPLTDTAPGGSNVYGTLVSVAYDEPLRWTLLVNVAIEPVDNLVHGARLKDDEDIEAGEKRWRAPPSSPERRGGRWWWSCATPDWPSAHPAIRHTHPGGSGMQCCGSGSGIRCLFGPWIRDGWKVRIRIRDEQSGSYLLELGNHFLGLKYVNSFMRIRDGKILIPDPGWKKVGSGINIPDPQHCRNVIRTDGMVVRTDCTKSKKM
jgi:hypothetical protein